MSKNTTRTLEIGEKIAVAASAVARRRAARALAARLPDGCYLQNIPTGFRVERDEDLFAGFEAAAIGGVCSWVVNGRD